MIKLTKFERFFCTKVSGRTDDLVLLSVSFSGEAGEVLNFFAYFFVSRQKSMWGMGQRPSFKIIFYLSRFKFRNKIQRYY